MAGVAGRRSSGSDAADPVRTGSVGASPGKSTLTGALDQQTPRGTQDVSTAARAEVAGAFGPRAQSVDYTVGAGPAEARGVNAVTIGGKVDFAPGKFDLDSAQGRARLGEETAHAVQQSNPGARSGVRALEGEAKQAGAEFASGRAPRAMLAASPELALADDPKDANDGKGPDAGPKDANDGKDAKDGKGPDAGAKDAKGPDAGAKDAKGPDAGVKDTTASTEVPDLQQGEVAAINAVLQSDPDKALALVLQALQRLDATQFSSDDLTEHKLHVGLATLQSYTSQGKAFQAFLAARLDEAADKAGKTRDKLTKGEVKKVIQTATPSAADKDILVKIGTGFFSSASMLYSTVRHEFIHVQQLRKDFLGRIAHAVLPPRVADPGIGSDDSDHEVEPYLWEMENLAHTGLKAPHDLVSLVTFGTSNFESASKGMKKSHQARFETAFKTVWKAAIDAHIAAIADLYTSFSTGGTVPDGVAVENLTDGLSKVWAHRKKFGNPWSSYEASHKTAVDHAAEMAAAAKADAFTKLLDDVDKEVAAGYASDFNAVRRWDEVNDAWAALDAKTQKTMKPRYDKLAPALWEKVFDAVEVQVQKQIDKGQPGVADDLMKAEMDPLFRKPYATVKTKAFNERRDALKKAIAAGKKGNK